jgi:ABC-type amino acid transport substrate-binding protein
VSKGFLIYAEGEKYVEQAYALALSIKYSQREITSVSLVTNDTVSHPDAFDNIIPIPWYDRAGSALSAEHRWKLYHVTPYQETIILDADMLLLEDISTWWEYCSNYDIHFCSKIQNYKLENVVDTFHRKAFTANSLPNPYFALHYFKKSDKAHEFYKVLEFVCNNWQWCYDNFALKEYQEWLSMDLAAAIAIDMMGLNDEVVDIASPLEFIHMKTPLQGWKPVPASWQDTIPFVLNKKGDLVVGNIKQSKLFHYVEKNFITKNILTRLEELAHATS